MSSETPSAPGPDVAAPGGSPLFRKTALDRLASPEPLDRVAVITHPRDWAGLAVMGGLMALALVWSVAAAIPTRVTGQGILISSGGNLEEAISPAEGSVVSLDVQPGDEVKAGQVLARVGQPELAQSLDLARLDEADAARELNGLQREAGAYATARGQSLSARRAALQQSAASADDRLKALQARLVNYERLLAEGFSSQVAVENLKQDIATARQAASDARAEVAQLDADETAARNRSVQDIAAASDKLASARQHVQQLELELAQAGKVTSPSTGRVTEVKTAVGAHLAAGASVASVESGRPGLQLLLYLPPDQGKRVKPGMEARISPSTARKEEFGTLVGVVRNVSEFPSTPDGMRGVLQNDRLVEQFSASGPPFAARIDLVPDASNPTGYRWAAGNGPPSRLSSGTLAEADVTVSSRRPISFLLPFLRKAVGL